jgi:hypothetical protein
MRWSALPSLSAASHSGNAGLWYFHRRQLRLPRVGKYLGRVFEKALHDAHPGVSGALCKRIGRISGINKAGTADSEKSFHPADGFGDHVARLASLNLAL